ENAAAVVSPEQPIEEVSLLLAGNCRRTVLRTASVVAEGDQQRLPLGGALGVAAVKLLKLIAHALERKTLLIDLAVEWTALLGRVAENGEETGALAADVSRLCHQAIDVKLLAGDHVFGTPNLVGASRVGVALVECGQLRLKPLACRVGRLCVGRRQSKSNRQRG